MFRKVFAVLCFYTIMLVLLLTGTPVMADTAQPDSVNITSKYVTRSILETNDTLIFAYYNIEYATNDTPVADADDTFIFRFIDTDGTTELAATLPYAYHDGGYGDGVVSFYFPAADNITWNGAYILRIAGNPTAFTNGTIPGSNSTFTPVDYTSETESDAIIEELGGKVIAWAELLSAAWGGTIPSGSWLVEYQDSGEAKLSDYGAAYFNTVIPGLNSMCPSIYLLNIDDPEYVWESHNVTMADYYANRFDSTDVGSGIENFADLFDMDFMFAAALPLLIVMIAMCAIGAAQGSIISGMLNSVALGLGGVWNGWIPMGLMMLLSFLLFGYMMYHILFKNG